MSFMEWEELVELADGSLTEEAFWSTLLERCALHAEAKCGWIFVDKGGHPQTRIIWPEGGGLGRYPGVARRAEQMARMAAQQGQARETQGEFGLMLAAHLGVDASGETIVAVFLIDPECAHSFEVLVAELGALPHIPRLHHLAHDLALARLEGNHLLEVLLLTAELAHAKNFTEMAMKICNHLATRFSLEWGTLGWQEEAGMRLRAASHMDGFERTVSLVQVIESAMSEAADQDEEILYPAPVTSRSIIRDHEICHREQGGGHLLSLPVRFRNEVVGAVLCTRWSPPFSAEEVRLLRLTLDMVTPGVVTRRGAERGVGACLLKLVREGAGRILGLERTWAKVGMLLLALGLGVLGTSTLSYRVEGSFMLATDDLRVLSAPYNGYIEEVFAKVGDMVARGQKLLTLDRRSLLLEETAATAEVARYATEAEKAKSLHSLAEMRIAMAQIAQAQAKKEKISFHLGAAVIQTPVAGIVVEGDLAKLLGAPVKEGDTLFKVASMEHLYIEIDLMERDLHEIGVGKKGEIAFLGRPQESFPVEVERIDPIAVVKKGQNIFVVRARVLGHTAPWWRPGMSGVAKIDVEKRSILWIFTHRMVEFLRLLFWW
ncbi:MAG: efflux RND transporter periplasmic adaptor subunit [Magnetococcales bacterium]|nr:efflux RND transporter periplasmic adaptor subunit [Magnetococcales bacterium]